MPRQTTDDNQFIDKLHKIISVTSTQHQEGQTNFVEWMPDNKGFVINDQKMFTNLILVSQFKIGRFDSFIRKLNKFGFKRSKVAKNKIRFFHKQFTKDSKTLNNIKKLSKQESLPKHIKLRMMRQKLQSQSQSEQNCLPTSISTTKDSNKEILPHFKIIQNIQLQENEKKNFRKVQKEEKQDIGIYLIKQIEAKNFKNKLSQA